MFAEFYKDSEIFLTGGSGVVGKAAIEKLLRSCDVKRIFVLLRNKKGMSPEDRLEKLKTSRIFNVLKERKPNELDKVFAIPGDLSEDHLGISSEHRDILKNVSVFFHSGATTKFDEPLQVAIRLNVKSTLEALKLAETFHNLRIFVHLSTFFSNPHISKVEDKIFPAVLDWRLAIKMIDSDPEIVDAIMHKITTGFPNTYSFTKHIAEQVVNDYRSKLPVAVYRPSVAIEEPEPGFSETRTGVMGLILIWGAGICKVIKCNLDLYLDVTPLDLCTKYLLMYAAKTGRYRREQFDEACPVAMSSSAGYFNYNARQLSELFTKGFLSYPIEKSLWVPGTKATSCGFIFTIYLFFMQILPALMIDVILRLIGQKPVMMAIQRKIAYGMGVVSFFMCNNFQSPGPTEIDAMMEISRGTEFDIESIVKCCVKPESATKTFATICWGCRKFLMNEDDSTLSRARKILKAKIIVYNICRGLLLYWIGSAVYRRVMTMN